MNRTSEGRRKETGYRPIIGIAIVSVVLCGLFFPLLITGLAQLMPYQANGEIVQFNGRSVGSNLIAQNFSASVFFHPRPSSQSASGVDPDITLPDAYSQIPRIHNATGISVDALVNLVNQKAEGTLWVFGSPYVNVLQLNVALIVSYPAQYGNYS